MLFGQLGAAIRDHREALERIIGVVTIVLGVVFLGGIGLLQREFKFHRLPQPGWSARRCSVRRSGWPGRRA